MWCAQAVRLGFLVVVLPLLCTRAYAQAGDGLQGLARGDEAGSGSADRESRRDFQKGIALANQQRFQEAARAFEHAWQRSGRASAAFNLATVRYRLGDYVRALRSLDDYETARAVDDPHVAAAERFRDQLTQLIGGVVLHLRPATARVALDGDEMAISQGGKYVWQVNPGHHRLHLSLAQHRTQRRTFDVEPGSHHLLEVELQRAAVNTAGEDSWLRSPWLWGVVGALVVTGLSVGLILANRGGSDEAPSSTGLVIGAQAF